jgi:hypothetical protein
MNARASENYLAISRSSSASKSVWNPEPVCNKSHLFFNLFNPFWHTDKNFCFYAEVNFWDFVRNDNSNKGTTARLNVSSMYVQPCLLKNPKYTFYTMNEKWQNCNYDKWNVLVICDAGISYRLIKSCWWPWKFRSKDFIISTWPLGTLGFGSFLISYPLSSGQLLSYIITRTSLDNIHVWFSR